MRATVVGDFGDMLLAVFLELPSNTGHIRHIIPFKLVSVMNDVNRLMMRQVVATKHMINVGFPVT